MTHRSTLSENELKALAYFVVGVSSEGNIAGRDVSSRLSFAGDYHDGKMFPRENSGLSIGTLQKDLGQDRRDTATALVSSYQAWAKANYPVDALSDVQALSTVDDLSRRGSDIRNQGNRAIDAKVKASLDIFLRSEGGNNFVHQRDKVQVEHIYEDALVKLTRSPCYDQASMNERIELAAIVAKGFNQNERVTRIMLNAMTDLPSGPATVRSLDDVRTYSQTKFSRSMREGRDAVLLHVEVFKRLRYAGEHNPLRNAWEEVLKDPLIVPSQTGADAARPQLAAHYTTIKNLFLDPTRAKHFIEALEQKGDYSYGSPQATGTNKNPGAGFFVTGSDFVQWNADGRGITYLNGQWSHVSREDITRTRLPDQSIDLAIQRNGVPEPLLHVGPTSPSAAHAAHARALRQGMRGDDVKELQALLAALDFTDARGRALQPDGDFGPTTHAAIQTFQRDHDLTADGIAGPSTLAAMREVAHKHSIGQPDAPYLQSEQPGNALSAFRALAPGPVDSAPLMPTVSTPHFDAIRTLQTNLNTLGVVGMTGKPLVAHGEYDMSTRTAVARFQSDHGLPVTGEADKATHSMVQGQAFIADLQQGRPAMSRGAQPLQAAQPSAPEHATSIPISAERPHDAQTVRDVPPVTPITMMQSCEDPRHADNPNHDLFNELHRRIPGASDERLLQFTAACHENGIKADNLDIIHMDQASLTLVLHGKGLMATPTIVDLSTPPPRPEQAIQQIQQSDQMEAQMMQEIRSQNMQLSQHGPTR